MEQKQEEQAQKSHQVDSLNLLIFVSLLILTVLWIVEPSGHSQADDAGPVELDVDKQRCEVLPILIRI